MAEKTRDLGGSLPDRPPRREIWVGLFAIAGLISVVVVLLALTDPGTFRGRHTVTTTVESVGGLRKGDPVQMRGVNIGRVQSFDIGGRGVRIRMELEREYPVPADSRVVLRSSGLLGGMVADIVPGDSDRDIRGGEELPGRSEPGLFDSAGGTAARADTVLERVEDLLARETVAGVTRSVEEMGALIRQLSALVAAQQEDVRAMTASLRSVAGSLEQATAGPALGRTVARVDTVAAQLSVASARIAEASGSIDALFGRLERGEGTLGRLTTEDELYENLTAATESFRVASENLNLLLEDIRANPRRYLDLRIF